jgi:hypothetical protein
MGVDITALYCCLDDFCKVFGDWEAHRLIPSPTTRQRSGKLSRAEMLLIVVLFHLSPFKHFKAFYHYGIGQQHRACFGALPHYDRFVSLTPRLFAPLMVLLHSLSGAQTGIYFADSTQLAVCHNRRIHRHRVFDGLAARGKTSMGWFYGLKLHFVINHKGQVLALRITPGNTADSAVLDILKCEMGLEHSRHRSVMNAMFHILSCLVAYAFRPGKPSISPTACQIKAYP